MFIGAGASNIENLRSFAMGFQEATQYVDNALFKRLNDESGSGGWDQHLLAQTNGDHPAAVAAFFERLHAFVIETRPQSLVDFNAQPQRSQLINGPAEIRLKAHREV